jgi:hypothetical protein
MRIDMTKRSVGLLLAVLVACGATPAAAKRGNKVVKLKLGPFKIEANRDREVCQAVRVPAIGGMEIDSWEARSRIRNGGTTGSHHLVLYGYGGTDSTQFPSGLVDDSAGCAAFGPPDFFKERVFLSGSGGESIVGKWSVTSAAFPGDIAQVVPTPQDAPGDAWLVINSHYFNEAPKRAKALVRVTLRLIPLDPRKRPLRQWIHTQASRGIMLPPGTRSRDLYPDVDDNPITAAVRVDGAPNPSSEGATNPASDVCVFAMSTHMHKRGTRFLIRYDEGDVTETVLDWPDWLHAGTVLFPGLTPIGAPPFERHAGLLRAYTEANGFPQLRYTCEMDNGVERDVKTGCEQTPGEVPGAPWDGVSDGTETHPKPCGKDAVACEGKPCVSANLVFGPESDDDMCVFTALVYDPRPGVPPDQACRFATLD